MVHCASTTGAVKLADYDAVIINSSGGKDSQTMLRQIVRQAQREGYPLANLIVAHADLGRMEWEGTKALAETQAAFHGIAFEAIARPQGDLLAHVRQRGMWPSSTTRYCTSDHKRGQISKIVTRISRGIPKAHTRILNCLGLRAQESSARAKRQELVCDTRLSNQSRTVDTWLPILHWTEDEVWADIRASGVPHHRAYDLGMPRLSCILCIFAPKVALVVAGRQNRELLDEYAQVEREIDHLFRQDCSIADVVAAVEEGDDTGKIPSWEM